MLVKHMSDRATVTAKSKPENLMFGIFREKKPEPVLEKNSQND